MEEALNLIAELNNRFTKVTTTLNEVVEITNNHVKVLLVLKDKINSIIEVSNNHSQILTDIQDAMNGWEKPLDEDEGYIN